MHRPGLLPRLPVTSPLALAGGALHHPAPAQLQRDTASAGDVLPAHHRSEDPMHAVTPLYRRARPLLLAALLAALLPLSALAAPVDQAGGELSSSLAQARAEVRSELAAARAELQAGNLELGESLRLVGDGTPDEDTGRPRGEITPAGEFLVDGRAVATTARQRKQLLDYRTQVIALAVAGIDIGEQAAEVALASVDRGMFSLLASAMTGRLERQLEHTLRTTLEPGIVRLCGELPALLEAQQALATSLPEFRPYATLRADEVQACESDLRREFAHL